MFPIVRTLELGLGYRLRLQDTCLTNATECAEQTESAYPAPCGFSDSAYVLPGKGYTSWGGVCVAYLVDHCELIP